MSNEEFQTLVLKKLDKLDGLSKDVAGLKDGQDEIIKRLDRIEALTVSIEEQTKKLTEFKQGIKDKFHDIVNL